MTTPTRSQYETALSQIMATTEITEERIHRSMLKAYRKYDKIHNDPKYISWYEDNHSVRDMLTESYVEFTDYKAEFDEYVTAHVFGGKRNVKKVFELAKKNGIALPRTVDEYYDDETFEILVDIRQAQIDAYIAPLLTVIDYMEPMFVKTHPELFI